MIPAIHVYRPTARVVCVMAHANQPARKTVERMGCGHRMTVNVEEPVARLGRCLECESGGRNA